MSLRKPLIAIIASSCAIGIGAIMVPHPLEEVAMLLRDRQFERALEVADGYVAGGETRPELLMQTFILHERYGDLAKGKAALQAYLEQRPNDVEGWRKAVWVYGNAHRADPLTHALENVVRLTNDPADAHRLARLYRLHGHFADEMRVLSAIAPDELGLEQGTRLASLLIGNGRFQRATGLLRKLDETLPLEARQPRMMLFDLLLAQGTEAQDEAAGRADRWLSIWKTGYDRADMVGQLVQAGGSHAAVDLAAGADPEHEQGSLGEIALTLARLNRRDLIAALVDRWSKAAVEMAERPATAQMREIVAVARAHGLTRPLMEATTRLLQSKARPEVSAILAEAVLDEWGLQALMPYRGLIGPQMLEASPVLGARLMLAEGNRLAARHFVARADLSSASEASCANWLETAREVLSARELLDDLAIRARSGTLPACLARPALELASTSHRQAELMEILAGLATKREAVAAKL
jgi:hypothetical protein